LRKFVALAVIAALFFALLPSVEARTPTYILVVGETESGGHLSVVRVLGREYTLEVLPKAAQFALLGHGVQTENLYSHLAMSELVSRTETALGIKIARHVRFNERLIPEIVQRLGGVAIGGRRYSGAEVRALLDPPANGLYTRSINQIEIVQAIAAEALRPANWLKLPGIVRAFFAGVQTNYTLTAALGLLVQRPTKIEVVYLNRPAIYFEGRYYPQNLPLPVVVDGRTLVPLRVIEQISGATISWHEGQQRATISHRGRQVDMIIGQRTAWVNGQAHALGMAPRLVGGRTMVPFRFIFEQLGYTVEWVERDFVVLVSTK